MAIGDQHFPAHIVPASASTFNAGQANLTLDPKPPWAKYVRMTVEFESDSVLVLEYDLSKSGRSQGGSVQRVAGSQNDVNEILVNLTDVVSPVLTIVSVGYYERDEEQWADLTGLSGIIISNIQYIG